MRWPLLFIAAVAGALSPLAGATAKAADIADLARQEARLAVAGWRLTTGSVRWCPVAEPQPGWIFGDPRRFDARERAAAQQVYGTHGEAPFVAAVAPGSPGDRAGLARGTEIAAIEGQPIPTLGPEPTIRIDAAIVMIAALEPAAPFAVTDTANRTYRLDAAPGCASAFRIEREGVQAAANGKLVRLRLSLAQSITDDAELAAVVAHELAHNILRHPARLADDRSIDGIRATELEADRLSVWLLADAGYDPFAAVRFWQRHKRPLIRAPTHPPTRERIAAITAEIATMTAARAANPAATPLELRGAFLF